MRLRSRRLLALLWLLVGCRDRTEVVIGVATDLRARGQIDTVVFQAARNGTALVQQHWDLSDVPAGRYELPGSFGLYSPDGSQPTVELTLKGYRGKDLVVERDAILSLVSDQTLFMRMSLVSSCDALDGPTCASNQSCIEGVCRPLRVETGRLPRFSPELVTSVSCNSGTHFIVSSSGLDMQQLPKGCQPGETCQEGTCLRPLPSDDGGTTQGALWTQQSTPSTYVLHAMWGTSDGADVFAVGEGGTVLHLGAAGPTAANGWIKEPTGVKQSLFGVWGSSATDVFAVGDGGVILHRSTSGWATESAPSVGRLDAVWGSGAGDVWAVGRTADRKSAILHRSAGVWQLDTHPGASSGNALRAVWGAGAGIIWAAGSGGTLLRFDGASWSPTGQLPGDLLGVWTLDTGDALIAGAGGTIARTVDTALHVEDSGVHGDLFAAWAAAPNDLYVAGDYGVVLHSSGDGKWTRQSTATQQPIFALWGSAHGDLYAAGRDGVVLHSTTTPPGPVDDLSTPADLSTVEDLIPPIDMTKVIYIDVFPHFSDAGRSIDLPEAPVTVSVGTYVVWRWQLPKPAYQITSCSTGCLDFVADGQFCSNPTPTDSSIVCAGPPQPGPASFTHFFGTPGTYSYFASMSSGAGQIIVQ
jgi:hypothetical protein